MSRIPLLDGRGLTAVSIQGKRVSDHLDLIRGLAAIAVLAYHVRFRFFFDYGDLKAPSHLASAFYALSSFGHDAVMVFFVLSGYFISMSVLRDHAADRWSWKRYLFNRFTRLYLVLLPGLLLTLFWDGLGLTLYPDSPAYTGAPRPWVHDFFPVQERLNVETFFANVFFLQMIVASPFGSNMPLWSLTNEFWYYMLFPLGWLALVRPASVTRSAIYLVLFTVVILFIGPKISIRFPIWLLGTLVCLLPQIPMLKREHAPIATMVAVGLFCSVVISTHMGSLRSQLYGSFSLEYVNSIAFALLLYFMIHNQAAGGNGIYARVSKTLANSSYSLYILHTPLLVFLRAALVPDTPWLPDLPHVALAMAIAIGCIIYALVIARFTEAKTDLVRGKLMSWFMPPKEPAVE